MVPLRARLIALYTGLVALLSFRLLFSMDPDFGWHLALGRYMHEHGGLVRTLVGYDYFANKDLIDHQWLAHYLLYPVYQWFGYPAFIVLSAGVVLGTVLMLDRLLERQAMGVAARIAVVVFFLLSMDLVYGVRLQLLLPLGAVMAMTIGKSSWSFGYRCLAYAGLFMIGDNLHGGFVVLALIPILLESRLLLEKKIGQYLLLMGVVLISLSINPYGVHFLELMRDYLSDSTYKSYIAEWRSVFSQPIRPFDAIPLTIVTLFLLTVNKYWKKVRPSELMLAVVFVGLGMEYIRFMPIGILAASPILAGSLQEVAGTLRLQRLNKLGVVMLIVLWSVLQVAAVVPQPLGWLRDPRQSPTYPAGAFTHISQKGLCSGGVFTAYIWGGYVVGFYPQFPVFIDGRGPQLKVDGDETLLGVYRSIYYETDTQKQEALLGKYDISCLVLPPTEDDTQSAATLRKNVQASQLWERAYADADSVVFIRKP